MALYFTFNSNKRRGAAARGSKNRRFVINVGLLPQRRVITVPAATISTITQHLVPTQIR